MSKCMKINIVKLVYPIIVCFSVESLGTSSLRSFSLQNKSIGPTV